MPVSSFIRLVLLAAIWGGSFLFMRIATPSLGPAWVAGSRVTLAAIFLAVVAIVLGKQLQARRYWRHYFLLGLLNSAMPFLLFAYAAQTLSASLLAILNATSPMWGAVIAALTGRQALSGKSVTGLGLGTIGVAILVGTDTGGISAHSLPAIAAALTASFCYGIASNYAASAPRLEPYNNAYGSMWAAVFILLPVTALSPITEVPSTGIVFAVLTLGIVCSGIAYLMYFRLIKDEGATSALSVTYLVPLFGILWGYLFLHEALGWHTMIGALVVLAGTMLVTGFSLRAFRR